MIIGNLSDLAIESCSSIAYESLSARALGFFVIHIAGRCYGVREPDATWLACSFSEVERRLIHRGKRTANFATEPDAGKIVAAFRNAGFATDGDGKQFFNIPALEFYEFFYKNELVWAPDGDEAFDDGSNVLQFDIADRVRLIAFQSSKEGYGYNPVTLVDVWLEAEKFYGILQDWRDAFKAEWLAPPKLFKADGSDEQHMLEVMRLAKLTESIRLTKTN